MVLAEVEKSVLFYYYFFKLLLEDILSFSLGLEHL